MLDLRQSQKSAYHKRIGRNQRSTAIQQWYFVQRCPHVDSQPLPETSFYCSLWLSLQTLKGHIAWCLKWIGSRSLAEKHLVPCMIFFRMDLAPPWHPSSFSPNSSLPTLSPCKISPPQLLLLLPSTQVPPLHYPSLLVFASPAHPASPPIIPPGSCLCLVPPWPMSHPLSQPSPMPSPLQVPLCSLPFRVILDKLLTATPSTYCPSSPHTFLPTSKWLPLPTLHYILC